MTVTDLDRRDPLSDTVLTTPAVHDAWTTTTAKKCVASAFVGCLAQMRYLLAAGNVMSPNEGVEDTGRHLTWKEWMQAWLP